MNLAKWVRNYLAVRDHFGNARDDGASLAEEYRDTVTQSNQFLTETMTEIFDFYESGDYLMHNQQYKEKTRINAGKTHQLYCSTLKATLRNLHAGA